MGIYRILWCGVVVAGSVAAGMFLSWEPLLGLGVLAAIFGPLVGAGLTGRPVGPPRRCPTSSVLAPWPLWV